MRFFKSGSVRRVVLAAAVCTATIGAGLAGAGSASAAVAPQSVVPAAVPAVFHPASCSVPWNDFTYTWAGDPYWRSPDNSVAGDGYLRLYSDLCNAQTHTEMNTKVCGSFGCNYESWATGPTSLAYTGDTWTSVALSCRGGTNRYQTHQLGYVPGFGGTSVSDAGSVGQLEFTC